MGPVQFSKDLVGGVLAGEITVSLRLWTRPKVKVGGRYPVGDDLIEVDRLDVVRFADVTPRDVVRSGERSLESLRERAAHAGPIDDDTELYRVEFHVLRGRPARTEALRTRPRRPRG